MKVCEAPRDKELTTLQPDWAATWEITAGDTVELNVLLKETKLLLLICEVIGVNMPFLYVQSKVMVIIEEPSMEMEQQKKQMTLLSWENNVA